MLAVSLFKTKLQLLSTVLISGFQSPRELWNPLSEAVPGKFHGFGGDGKPNCLQDRANFQRSRAWQVIFFYTATLFMISPHTREAGWE